LNNHVPHFPVYLLSGLLAWNLFSTSTTSAVRSVIDNANLVKKVYFPREVLPLASIGSALVDFALQSTVLILFMLAFRYPIHPENLVLLPIAIVALLLFTCAMSLLVAAINVHYRDTQHLLALLLLVWFWFTPVVWPSGSVQQRASQHWILGSAKTGGLNLWHLYLLNPLADIMYGFQRALYGTVTAVVGGKPTQILIDESVLWIFGLLVLVCIGSIVFRGFNLGWSCMCTISFCPRITPAMLFSPTSVSGPSSTCCRLSSPSTLISRCCGAAARCSITILTFYWKTFRDGTTAIRR
jgi:ABC-2 type transport system permease protein